MQFVSAVTLLALSPGFDWSMVTPSGPFGFLPAGGRRLRPSSPSDPFGFLRQAVGGFDVWLTLLTYVLVLTRTASELRAALKIKRAGEDSPKPSPEDLPFGIPS